MSTKFNKYAKRVDATMREQIEKFCKLSDRYEDAKRRQAKAKMEYDKALKSDMLMPSDVAVEAAKTQAALVEAEREYNDCKTSLPNVVKNKIAGIRGELEADLNEELAVDPAAVDNNALKLMEAGVLTTADYKRLSDDYNANPTMTRLIAKFAERALEEIPVDEVRRSGERATLRSVIDRGDEARPEAFLQNFDGLATIADQVARNPWIFDQWEPLSAPIVEVF